jgi:hypothetical protein
MSDSGKEPEHQMAHGGKMKGSMHTGHEMTGGHRPGMQGSYPTVTLTRSPTTSPSSLASSGFRITEELISLKGTSCTRNCVGKYLIAVLLKINRVGLAGCRSVAG